MKILLISAYWNKGGAEAVFRASLRIFEKKYQVSCFVPDQNGGIKGLLTSLVQLGRKIRQFQPDIVHIHNYHTPLIFVILAWHKYRSHLSKIIFTAHDFRMVCAESFYGKYRRKQFIRYPNHPDERSKWLDNHSSRDVIARLYKKIRWIWWFRIWQIQRLVDHIFTPSHYMKAAMQADQALRKNSISLLRNPIAPRDKIEADPDSPSPSQIPKMIFLGRLSFEKGLIEFLCLLAKSNPPLVQMDIFGDGPLKTALEETIDCLQLQHSVFLRGKIPPSEVESKLKAYDVLVLPSIWSENAPLALVEGALSNLRLLTGNYGGQHEIAQLCGGHYLFDPQQPYTLRKALTTCANDIAQGTAIQNRNCEYLLSCFGETSYLTNFESTIKRIMNPASKL